MVEIDKRRIKRNLKKAKHYEEEKLTSIEELKKRDKLFKKSLEKLKSYFNKPKKKTRKG